MDSTSNAPSASADRLDQLDLANPHRKIHAGVILLNDKVELLDVAPIEILSGFTKAFLEGVDEHFMTPELKSQMIDMEIHWVSEHGGRIPSKSVDLVTTDSFETCPPLDVALMGAVTAHYQATPGELAYIQRTFVHCTAFIAICGGVVPVMQAGLLSSRTATAPRMMVSMFRQMAPNTNWVEKRWCRDGKLWTSGTLLNGLDLMRAFVLDEFAKKGGKSEKLVRTMVDMTGLPVRDVDYQDEGRPRSLPLGVN